MSGGIFLPALDAAIQTTRGGIGGLWGQQYDIYRITPETSGSVVQGAPLYPAVGVHVEKLPPRNIVLEGVTFELVSFKANINALNLQLGDILVQTPNSYGFTGEAFCVAQKRPTKETVLMRVETNATVMHPYTLAGAAGEQPDEGIVWNDNYGGPEADNDQDVVLQNGLYLTDATYSITPATIPIGLIPRSGVSDSRDLHIPTEIPDTNWAIYVPLMPGYQISQNDKIKAWNQDTYVVRMDSTTVDVGISGYVLLAQRITT